MNATFLAELGTEELPPASLKLLAMALANNVKHELAQYDLGYEAIQWYATPRRLAIKVMALDATEPDRAIVKRGPALAQAFDAKGEPTKAAASWARTCGISVAAAEHTKTDKGSWLTYTMRQKGRPVTALLGQIIERALTKLPISKAMRWGDNHFEFLRPVHSLTLMYGRELIPYSLYGINADTKILGHRFMGQQQLCLTAADDYPQKLAKQGYVLADYEQRRALIKQQVLSKAAELDGEAHISDSLLDEVTALVEWPVVLVAHFEAKFLQVPAEILVSTMEKDQKYFPVYDKNHNLMPFFIFVTNIISPQPQQIIAGNEKVIRPRLNDAEFFYQSDLTQRLEDRLPRLATLVFQKQLGSLQQKATRISALAARIATRLGVDSTLANRAGLLAKCDLVTNVVFEFPETQGVVGAYLARHDGEEDAVANAIGSHYLPRFAGDRLPADRLAASVAIADKMDTLVGIFGIGLVPKGDKDPFALRRAALGILRILVEKTLPLDLVNLATDAASLYGTELSNANVVADTVAFMQSRFRSWYLGQGYYADVLQAVLATSPTNPTDFDRRVKAVSHFRTLEGAAALVVANKRVANILAKVLTPIADHIDTTYLQPGAEVDLKQKLAALDTELMPYFEQNDYQAILLALASLRAPIDAFFDEVMVLAADPILRQNRLALLQQLHAIFLRVADISLLQL